MSKEVNAVIIMFGGSGDLAHRKLYPALFGLFQHGVLKDHFAVIGTARRPWSDDHYQQIVADSVREAGATDDQAIAAFAAHFCYQSHDVTDADHYVTLKQLAAKLDDQYEVGGNRLYYMAMAPTFFSTIATHLKSEELLTEQGFNRLIIEKPFGHDYASAKALNDAITGTFKEDQIYRIDHYLGKDMAQAILALRFANPWLKGVWNKDYIKDIQITLAEAVGVEERAGYYETAGALRDMVQNHVMQLVAYLTMDEPKSLTPEAIHQVKAKAFDDLHRYTEAEAKQNFVRAQYTAATIDGQAVPGYREEDGVAKDSMTDTFVAGKILTDNPNLAGVPIFIRTGKRLTRKSTQVTVTLKGGASPFGQVKGNQLTIYIEPNEGYTLEINAKKLGETTTLEREWLNMRHEPQAVKDAPEAYERLIGDVLAGDQTNFNHWNELAQTWRYVDVISKAWAKDQTMPTYEAGSMGPKAAFDLLKAGDHDWYWQPRHTQLAD
ncbi:glucose-6-phosphate dehydrogenase [Lacticaseibacillus jixianensis]|uniref:Glucose-6-phosphate 1-dehydrogenase n=1 Tax=Lacticaseibacillus jixianensis TaxID=2486012 RepID=A0ABW4B8H9_9LACO|nr:glucose-6-phosphate dehydrogenase [Lacticaseibacillus jixianensis]